MNASSLWRPSAALGVLRQRAALLERIRDYFREQQVLEVETPILSRHATIDPAIESLCLNDQQSYLHTSPEFAMKRLLAAGFGDCYQLGKVFRQDEQGRHHSREFTLLEWYRLGFSLDDLMAEVERLVRVAVEPIRPLRASLSFTYTEAFLEFAGLDVAKAGASQYADSLRERAQSFPSSMGDEIGPWQDLVMSTVVIPALPKERPVFITEYPAEQAALAQLKTNAQGVSVAERFELFIDGIELANAYHELTDGLIQQQRFEADQHTRQARQQPTPPFDQYLIDAMQHSSLPPCSGVALGIDRLVFVAVRADELSEVMAFAGERA